MPEHFIASKDASLETSIGRIQERLVRIDFHVEEQSWLILVKDFWSLHISECDCPMLFSNARGASTLAVLASALGKFVERLSCNDFSATTRDEARRLVDMIQHAAASPQ